jgi:hypothetical protein
MVVSRGFEDAALQYFVSFDPTKKENSTSYCLI